MEWQLPVVFVLSACLAGQLNRAIYRLAWSKRSISPWSAAPTNAAPRSWLDRIPVAGWWRMRRESWLHGEGFWIRPALIELTFAVALALLYVFEIHGWLMPIGAMRLGEHVLQAQFVQHACLIALLVVAGFIDWDEKTIPDEVTLPGVLLALVFAVWFPQAALPVWMPSEPPILTEPLRAAAPDVWPAAWDGPRGLWIALMCIVGWWYALLPKTLWYRGGMAKFIRYFLASLVRSHFSPRMTAIAAAASLATYWVWRTGGESWRAVLSAWIGLAAGGLTVWLVRIVASVALRQEAMGFGDVTLLGMIGAFLGWQPALLIFFLAPFIGVFVAVGQWLLTRRNELAFGPYLCVATVLVLVTWASVWERWGYPVYSLGLLVPLVLGVSLILLGALLWMIRLAKRIGKHHVQ